MRPIEAHKDIIEKTKRLWRALTVDFPDDLKYYWEGVKPFIACLLACIIIVLIFLFYPLAYIVAFAIRVLQK